MHRRHRVNSTVPVNKLTRGPHEDDFITAVSLEMRAARLLCACLRIIIARAAASITNPILESVLFSQRHHGGLHIYEGIQGDFGSSSWPIMTNRY